MKPVVSQSELRAFLTCPQQWHWQRTPAYAGAFTADRTMDRDRRTLLGMVVDGVLAQMYEQRWLAHPEMLVPRLGECARREMRTHYPGVSVAESPETLLRGLEPIWLSVLETVRAESLLAPAVFVRVDFAKEYGVATLKGQPDLVLEAPDGVTVVDVKLRARSSLTSAQLQVYRVLVEHQRRKPVTRMGYWLPREASVRWYAVRGSAEKTDQQIATALARMVAGETAPVTGSHCRYCGARHVCPEGAAYNQEKAGSLAGILEYHGKAEIVGF